MSTTAGKVIRCRAAVAWEAGKPLVIEEVEVAPPQAMEVRIKIAFTSLCHTDVYFWEAKGQTPVFPRIFGHEAGGIVESVGVGVTDLAPGDHVLPVFTGECKECAHCKSEESNMCNLLRINTDKGVMLHDGKSRFSINGKPIYHFVGTSTFSEYTVVHVGCLAKINPIAPLDKVCVLSCGISTGLGATLNVAKPPKGSTVAVFGLGAVGLAMSSTAGKVIRCRAAVAWEAGKPLVIEEVEVAPPQAMEVRIKIAFTSLCHTDVYFWEAKGQTPVFPRIFGHEAGGIVESVGEGVTDLAPGDHVLPVFTGECQECAHCKSEESNMCNLLRINTDRGVMLHDGKSRFSINGKPIYHFVGTSTFSEYTVVHVGCLAKINPLAPLDKVCVLSCGISTGLGATLNVAKPPKGSTVAVFGLGAVGLAAAEGARIAGASRIIGVDLINSRFEEAKKFGVTEFVNPKEHNKPVQEVLAEMTDGGVDRSIECTGNIDAMISAFECVHDGWGVAVLVGVPHKDAVFKTHPINVLNERTLKAAVAWEAGKPLVIEEVEVAPPQAMEVRIKIAFTSLCHTDVYFWEAKGQTPVFPRIFGHEAGGIVESVGEGVTDLAPGDHVLPVFTGECKECAHCKSEESNMCNLLRINTDRGVMLHDGKSRFSINGKPIYHFVGTSTFSEYTVVHVGCLSKINPLAPLDKVCILSCGISTGLGATLNVAKPPKGSTVAVFGLGAVGLAAAEGARIAGASRIIGVDLHNSRFEEAKKFGVTEFVNPTEHNKPVQEVLAEMTDGGVDRSIECTGNIDAMISAFECVHDGWGVAVLVGVPHKDAVFKTHPINVLNERTLKGTFFGNYKPRSDLPSVVEMYMNKELELEKFITHTVPFSEINKAFEYMLSAKGLRCIIRMDE
ncbi:Alcohol dehydrogenase, N-terminal [Dillenia turbinata]|uniref:Alcohol dehydrogenase 1 n=2 Tax=Magnoliopsida TaxID=3398 RepID=A0AAN8VNI6_9MAGN